MKNLVILLLGAFSIGCIISFMVVNNPKFEKGLENKIKAEFVQQYEDTVETVENEEILYETILYEEIR